MTVPDEDRLSPKLAGLQYYPISLRFPTLQDVVQHDNPFFGLGQSDRDVSGLVEYRLGLGEPVSPDPMKRIDGEAHSNEVGEEVHRSGLKVGCLPEAARSGRRPG